MGSEDKICRKLFSSFDFSAVPDSTIWLLALICWFGIPRLNFVLVFQRVLELKEGREIFIYEKLTYLLYTIHCFQSLENEMVRTQVLRLVSLPIWHNLSPGRLQVGPSSIVFQSRGDREDGSGVLCLLVAGSLTYTSHRPRLCIADYGERCSTCGPSCIAGGKFASNGQDGYGSEANSNAEKPLENSS